MVERPQKERNWLRRYTSEHSLVFQEQNWPGNAGDGYSLPDLNDQRDMILSPAETVFDFQLPELTEQDVAVLHRRAEYLLDEMEMGAADGAAFEREPQEQVGGFHQNGTDRAMNGRPPANPPQGSAVRSQVLPDAALPPIRSRPQRPAGKQEFAESPGVVSGRRRGLQPSPAGTTDRGHSGPAQGAVPPAGLSPAGRRRRAPNTAPAGSPSSITTGQIEQLEAEIAQLSDRVHQLQQGRRDLTGHAFSLLREASAILNTQPERLGRAEYNVRQVRTMLERSSEDRRRSARFVVLLLVYLSFWLTFCIGGLAALFLYGTALRGLLIDASGQAGWLSTHALPLFLTLLVGGLGGAVGAVISLIGQQRQGQAFDGQYVARYIIQPIMGVILALVIYAACAFLFSVQRVDFANAPLAQALPPLIALPAGLWQEMVYALLYRFSGVFRASRRR